MAGLEFKRSWALFGLVGLAVACTQVLDLEEREVDPRFSSGGASSGGAGGAATGGSGGGTAGSGGAVTADCESYCDTIEANCLPPPDTDAGPSQPNFQQWTTRGQCIAACAAFPPGDPKNPADNTLACRAAQAAEVTKTLEPATHCPAAGPAGVDPDGNFVCGDACDGYCALMAEACTGVDGSTRGFATLGECQTACGALPDLVGFHTGLDSGDSVQCRIWHASAALVSPSSHCGHARGEQICVPASMGGAGGTGGAAGSAGSAGSGTGGSAGSGTGGTAGSAGSGTGGSGG